MKRKRASRDRNAKPYLVFVSHATYDKWVAKVMCEKIEYYGLSTFRDDRDIEGGREIREAIMTAIRE